MSTEDWSPNSCQGSTEHFKEFLALATVRLEGFFCNRHPLGLERGFWAELLSHIAVVRLSIVGTLGSPAPVRGWLHCSFMCARLGLLSPTPAALHPCRSFLLQILGIHQTTNNTVMRIFWFPWMCRPFSHKHCREGEAW